MSDQVSDPFAAPAWVTGLTPILLAALPEPFSLLDEVGERHGSWEWTAKAGSGETARWLVPSVTPLADVPRDSRQRPEVEVAAWQLTPDASEIIESTVSRSTVAPGGRAARPDKRLAMAFRSVISRALRSLPPDTPPTGPIMFATGEALTGEGNEIRSHRLVARLQERTGRCGLRARVRATSRRGTPRCSPW